MSDILVSGNTGIIHLGAAVDTKVVALHGPTNPNEWGPYNKESTVIKSSKPCAPCLYLGFEYKCHKPDCMDEISVDEVFDAVRKHLGVCKISCTSLVRQDKRFGER